jgi:hypothetical protein
MFIGDQVKAAVSASAATARLASMASGEALTRASRAAWAEGPARSTATAVLPELAAVRSRGPLRRGAVSMLTLRWEVTGESGQLFPVLDADITVIPDGEWATLVGLDGVYRIPPGAELDAEAMRKAAVATIGSLLSRIAVAITDPPATGKPGMPGTPRPHRSWLDPASPLGPRQGGW